jgi:hypothetical protein
MCRIGRVEVITNNNKLETVYFPIPKDFRTPPIRQFFNSWRFLDVIGPKKENTLEEQQELESSKMEKGLTQRLESTSFLINKKIHKILGALIKDVVNWDRSGDKIDSLLKWSEKEILRRKEKVSTDTGGKFIYLLSSIAYYQSLWWNLSFIITYILNILMLLSTDKVKGFWPKMLSKWGNLSIYLFDCDIITVFCFL